MDIAVLIAELVAGHPGSGAYNADDELAAGELNVVNRTRNKTSLTGDEMFGATDGTEYTGLTDHQQIQWLSMCGRASVDPFQSANVALVVEIFGGGSATVTALNLLRVEAVSRAVELGLGFVSPGHVTEARLKT